MIEATADELAFVRRFVRNQSGMVLTEEKGYLIVSKLRSLARREQLASVADLVKQLRDPGGAALRKEMLEELLIGETCFFRDGHPFEALRSFVLPEIIRERAGDKSLNLWCAATSTGQEPYSLAMLLSDAFPELSRWSVSLLATDLSDSKLGRARAGLYTESEMARGMNEPLRSRFFCREPDGWRLRDVVRKKVTFAQMNLITEWPKLPAMDLVLLRNVVIYFDEATRAVILEKLLQTIRPSGYLMFGTSEALVDEVRGFTPIHLGSTIIYRRAP